MPVDDGTGGSVVQADAPEASEEWPSLTLEQGLSLQKELYNAFAEDEFQDKLEEVEAMHGKAYKNYTSDHTKLFLTVQDAILPKYGFTTGQKGVIQMLRAGACLNKDAQYAQNRSLLNQLLGLAPEEVEENQDSNPPERIADHQQITHSTPPKNNTSGADLVEIAVHQAIEGTGIRVLVPQTATFCNVREAIAKQVGRGEILTKGHLMRKENGVFSNYGDHELIGSVREVFVLKASLQVYDDEEALRWRQDLGEMPAPAPNANRLLMAPAAHKSRGRGEGDSRRRGGPRTM